MKLTAPAILRRSAATARSSLDFEAANRFDEAADQATSAGLGDDADSARVRTRDALHLAIGYAGRRAREMEQRGDVALAQLNRESAAEAMADIDTLNGASKRVDRMDQTVAVTRDDAAPTETELERAHVENVWRTDDRDRARHTKHRAEQLALSRVHAAQKRADKASQPRERGPGDLYYAEQRSRTADAWRDPLPGRVAADKRAAEELEKERNKP